MNRREILSRIQNLSRQHVGAIIVALIVVLSGSAYIWSATRPAPQSVRPPAPPLANNEPETPRAEADIRLLGTMSTSDEINSIKADLDSTLLDFDADLNALDTVLNSTK